MARADSTRSSASRARARAYYELTKPGITGYVMVTAGASAFVASRGTLGIEDAIHTMLSVGVATAGALTLNQFVERDVDAVMSRTRTRPIPTGRVAPARALRFGALLLVGGLAYAFVALGALTASLTALSVAIYHGVYTPLKTRSFVATLAGAVPGALPMIIGWTAATRSLDAGGFALFAIGYLWQLPHVFGLAWMLRDDYELVGFRLIPPGGPNAIGLYMTLSTALLIPVSWLPTTLGYLTGVYQAGATVLGLAFLGTAISAALRLTTASARRVFVASLLYHPLLIGLMLVDTAGLGTVLQELLS